MFKKGYFDSHLKQKNKLSQLILDSSGVLVVNSSTCIHINQFQTIQRKKNIDPTIIINYRLSDIPFIQFDSFSSTISPKILFEYDESDVFGDYNEAPFSDDFVKHYNVNMSVPVICGNNINCESWNIFYKSSIPIFNDETSVLTTTCEKIDHDECLSLKFLNISFVPTKTKPTSPPTSSFSATSNGGQFKKEKVYIIVGSALAIVTLISGTIIGIWCKYMKKRNSGINEIYLLNTVNNVNNYSLY